MRTAIVLTFLALSLSALPPPASAQYSALGLYSDFEASNCNLYDTVAQVHYVYAILDYTPGTLGLRFRVEQDTGGTLVYLTDLPDGLWAVGNALNGLTICFDQCVTGTPHLLLTTITYFGFGTSQECSNLRFMPAGGSNIIEALSCDGTLQSVYAQHLPVNDFSGLCTCAVIATSKSASTGDQADNDNFCSVVSTKPSTWGSIKALYR